MKITLASVFTILASCFYTNTASAQVPKFAHIDYLEVVDSLPTMMAANSEIETFYAAGMKTIEEMAVAYEESYNLYIKEKPTLSQVMIEIREKQLAEQEQIIQYKQESLQQDLGILNDRLFKPIEDNLKKAIGIVAERYKITYVFDINSLMYTAPTGGLDITKEVRAELLILENARVAAGG